MTDLAKHSQVIEEYLLTLYQLQESGEPIKAVNLAERLGVSPPTVHATLVRMKRDGLVEIGDSKELEFTKEGRKEAENIAYRHNLAEYFLCNTLGVSWHEVHKHAHQLEHAMTPLVVEKLAEFLGNPEFCPHGTPMPGTALPDEMISLTEAEVGTEMEVTRVSEELEESEELLRILHDHQVIPGQLHTLVDKSEVMSSLTLEQGSEQTVLPFHVADKIFVVPVASPA